ncbi:MAG: M23 family metallopeptidase [Verrucomicrobiae bacterium]|nr:M23 family metallopeptidase [Verrucomicrobiae bacterium]NNJ41977.1 M23 family metallopeptidase [Akkermansiaceae bacterium]
MRCLFYLMLWIFLINVGGATVRMPLADGFDFPVGAPDGKGYYKARGMRLRSPIHFGEDWNGVGGGDSDLGDAILTCADGVVMFAYDVRGGWGRCVLIRHAYRDPKSGKVKFIDSQYGHLRSILVKNGEFVKRGQKIGTMGSNRGMYPAHLHFEMRHNLKTGMQRESVSRTLQNWADPTQFIRAHRRLKKDWRKHPVPTGTYAPYKGFKGI